MPKLVILSPAARFLKKLKEKPLKDLFRKTVDEILIDPNIFEFKSGDLSGIFCCDIYYNKTNYELAYTLVETPTETIVIVLAGTRENFYEELKRYMKNL
ncbi:type II toxin-antitoxin system RelE/ParE family toxin [Desulfitobacterium sp. AusDCA]|uniref:type II toxin-antitoxin system RelE/ParE family toxin n=1 Tax=Desulfitobacterium sp. AusDCA TaxID=3240383 RepID=UPI003DA7A432